MSLDKWIGWFASLRAMGAGMVRVAGGRWRRCAVCERRVIAFWPWRGGWAAAPPAMRALRMVGSDLDHFACPRCGANDRDRHLRLYLQRTGLSRQMTGARILHFAPEAPLEAWLGSHALATYVRADLFPARDGIVRMAMESIDAPDASFDWVIANHVLEHVADLPKCISEIARVLAPGGRAILQTPWCQGLARTIEDETVTDPVARLHLYGQDDHVRLFGRDVCVQLSGQDLTATPLRHADVLPDIDPAEWGVNPDESLMLFERAR